jgi:hypothetical protein
MCFRFFCFFVSNFSDDDLDDDAEVDPGVEEAPTASRQAFDTNVRGPQVGMNVLG